MPEVINPDALYDDADVKLLLGCTQGSLHRAKSKRSLRYVRIGKRSLIFGKWILEWLESEPLVEHKKRKRPQKLPEPIPETRIPTSVAQTQAGG